MQLTNDAILSDKNIIYVYRDQHFAEKEGKDISSQIALKVAFTYRKANTFIKIFKLCGKWLLTLKRFLLCFNKPNHHNSTFGVPNSSPLF